MEGPNIQQLMQLSQQMHDNLRRVTRADIKDYVRRYIVGQHHVTGILLSPEMHQQLGTLDGEASS